ncbi:MAG: prolyl oligopeptidase family serine peptidase [Tepidisphaeraceae bacterium]
MRHRFGLMAFAAVALVLGIPSSPCAAGEVVSPAELKKGAYNTLEYTTKSGDVMHYYLYLPAVYTPTGKLPMLAEVHGAGPQEVKPGGGGSGKRYLGLNPSYSEEKYPCVFFEPLVNPAWKTSCWDGRGWNTGPHTHDLSAPPKGIAAILELLPKLMADLGCDANRCYVSGASNGGYATWDLITYRPDLFAAAIPICGAGDPSKVSRIVDIPIWAFHGTADKSVPFKGTTSMIEALEAAGGKPKHTYFEGMGHKTWDAAWKTPELVPWLFSQNKADRPAKSPAAEK